MPDELENQLAVLENSTEVFRKGPELLRANKTRVDKAIAVGTKLLAEAQDKGMSPELDVRMNNFLANCSKAKKELNEARSPVTQIMDELKKMFTSLENQLDVKKPETIPAHLQQARDIYAKEVAEEKRKQEAEAQKKADKLKEAVEIKDVVETSFRGQYNRLLLEKKQKLQKAFNDLSLPLWDAQVIGFKKFQFNLQFQPDKFTPANIKHHDASELETLANEVWNKLYADLPANYKAELTLVHEELIDKLPSKKMELEEEKRLADEQAEAKMKAEEEEKVRQENIQKANAKEKARLEAEADLRRKEDAKKQAELQQQQEQQRKEREQREAEESERLRKEAEENERQQKLKQEMNKQADQAMIDFDALASVGAEEGPEARQGYEITVNHQVGWGFIFKFWFEREGKELGIAEIGKKSMDQMKSYCEKVAHKDEVFIDSKHLDYKKTFKSVNRKAK